MKNKERGSRKPPPTAEQYNKLSNAQKLIQLTREQRKLGFIEALREKFTIHAACKVVDITRRTAYDWKAGDEKFAKDWEDALEDAVDNMEANMFQKALAGKDTIATIFMLKGNRPQKYKDRVSNEHTGKDGGPIEVESIRDRIAQALDGPARPIPRTLKGRDQ